MIMTEETGRKLTATTFFFLKTNNKKKKIKKGREILPLNIISRLTHVSLTHR